MATKRGMAEESPGFLRLGWTHHSPKCCQFFVMFIRTLHLCPSLKTILRECVNLVKLFYLFLLRIHLLSLKPSLHDILVHKPSDRFSAH